MLERCTIIVTVVLAFSALLTTLCTILQLHNFGRRVLQGISRVLWDERRAVLDHDLSVLLQLHGNTPRGILRLHRVKLDGGFLH